MSSFDYRLSTITKYRAGTSGDPYIDISESKKVINNQVLLSEIPVLLNRVVVSGYTEVQSVAVSALGATSFLVDYNEGIVTFNPAAEGLTKTFVYKGRGNHYISAARIWIQEASGSVTQTLLDITGAASQFSFIGSYNPATAYLPFNIVGYLGTTYMCILASTGNVPTNTTYFQKIAGTIYRGVYSGSTTYAINDNVINATGDTLYVSIVEGNVGQALTNTAKWTPTLSFSTVTAAEAARVTAESGRVTTESGRVSSESARVSSETTRGTNEIGRTTAESSRVTVEGNRVTAESGRASAESTRVSSETTRGTNESTRQTNETNRGTAETGRVNAESSRVTVEGNRVTAESGRTGAESTRVSNESSRVTVEGNRVTAETGRASAESTRAGNETTRQSNETARIGRDTAYQLIEAYNATHSYIPLNKVTYNGSTYQCILATTNNIPTNITYWILIAQAGANGAGTVATIISNDASIAITGTAQNPDLSVQTGITANKIVKRDANGNIPNNGLQSTSISANTTLTPVQSGVILVTTAASIITLTLPTAVGNAQLSYIFKKVDAGAGTISLATTSSQTIDGVTTKSITGQYAYIQVISDNANWQIFDWSNSATVTTNANLTGDVTSVGNATTIKTNVALTGIPTAPTASPNNNSNQLGTTNYIDAADALKVNTTTFNSHLADYTLQIPYVVSAGSANAYTATLTPALTAYTAGVALSVNINITNTGASTINVNGLGAKNILTSKGVAMTAGKLTAAGVYTLRYDGTNFILQGEGSDGNAIAADLLAGKTADNINGPFVGSMPDNSGAYRAGYGVNGNFQPNRVYVGVPKGYYDEVSPTNFVWAEDPNFIAANMRTDKPMFGLAGTMPVNGALTYNPSTVAQNIPAGHTTGGTVNPVGGSAGVADVASGKVFSSASGIGLTGTGASAKRVATGQTASVGGVLTISGLAFAPKNIHAVDTVNPANYNVFASIALYSSGVGIYNPFGTPVSFVPTFNASGASVNTGVDRTYNWLAEE